jgi:hypothetical protein
MALSGGTHDDALEVIPKALIVVAANFVPLLFFFFGTTEVGAIGTLSRGLYFQAEGPEVATAVVYFFLAVTSLLMAAVALVALLTPWRLALQALRAAGGLLGASILVLVLHLVLRYFVTVDWGERAALIFMVALFAAIGAAAWWLAKQITERG